ncbi:Protein CBG05108 [Caenorhabditis briggsae]|uniref:Uncharacterized protein n=2 Tax=Caenorhabditis briggsae TaxID=6238 RepID=A0AAE9IXQ0_CAEBR|nr:Protein CBG05108 [Caenorhabditis briggsae]ULU09459.1 hypothetical protein L3Y34_014095 [Caenorhabditis briggsae]CAP25696.1 Protein CBG05108 [Caenorhabditis briggsae]
MSSDQDAKVEAPDVLRSPTPSIRNEFFEADVPGFEFELEENNDSTSSDASDGIPDFESSRHPHVKLFVVVSAILANMCIIYKAFLDIPREYKSAICIFFDFGNCLDLDRDVPVMEIIEFLARTQLEVVFPLTTIVVFFITQLSISLMPGSAFKIRNSVPGITKYVYLTLFLHCLTSFLTSISMLHHLGNAQQREFWTEYLTVSGLCLFWLFQLFNMTIFTRLTSMNFIRARENFNRRIGVEA